MTAQTIILISLCILIAGLKLLGRPWRCDCGQTRLYVSDVNHRCYSQHLFGPWTFSHFVHGIAFYSIVTHFFTLPLFITIAIVVLIESLWEIIENTPYTINWFRAMGDRGYKGDARINSYGDLIACILGALFTYWIF